MIADLSFTIALWIVWYREPMGDLLRGAESSHFTADEVHSVVGYDGVREIK